MHNVKFVYYLFIYMIKIPLYAIDFVGKFSDLDFNPLFIYFLSEVLCQEALQCTIGNHLLWSTSRDTQEGSQGKFVSFFLSLIMLFFS